MHVPYHGDDFFLIEKIADGDNIIHQVSINCDLHGGWYTQLMAIQGMLSRAINRWAQRWRKSNTVEARTRFRDCTSFMGEGLKVYDSLKVIKHKDVWEFFYHIGYDHKNKNVSNTDKYLIIFRK